MSDNRRTGRLPLASERTEHVAQVRTRRTAAPDQPAADPSSIRSPAPRDEMNQRSRSASTSSFSTQSVRSGPWRDRDLTSALPPKADSIWKSRHVRKMPRTDMTDLTQGNKEAAHWQRLNSTRRKSARPNPHLERAADPETGALLSKCRRRLPKLNSNSLRCPYPS
jgi:hypothetical protein